MGRPKQKKELKRSRKVTIMLNESEYKQLSGNADIIGVTLSTYIRSKSLMGYIRIPKNTRIDNENMRQLSSLGGLLKKHYLDTGGEHKEITRAILDDMVLIVQEIRKGLNDREAHN